MTNTGGRPTLYRDTMPQEMLEMMSNGAKDAWIYAKWGICKDTFYRWLKEYPELKNAHDKGMPLCEVWWEQKGMEMMERGDNKAFNYWIAFMNRKFGWSKGQGGDTQQTININQMTVFNQQTREELLDFIKTKMEDPTIIDVIPEVKVIVNDSKDDN